MKLAKKLSVIFAGAAAMMALTTGCGASSGNEAPAHETGDYCFGLSYTPDANGMPQSTFVFNGVTGMCY